MTEAEMRTAAWNNALHCQGTHAVFAARLRRLKLRTKLRDFWAFAIPIIIGVLASSNELSLPEMYQSALKVGLALAAMIQLLIALWSVFSRWDEELAYSSRATRDAYEMKQAWQSIGEGKSDDIAQEFKLRASQQTIIDSHDIQQNVSEKERNLGMRSGLIEYRRKCAGCSEMPTKRTLPWWPKTKCAVCGGN